MRITGLLKSRIAQKTESRIRPKTESEVFWHRSGKEIGTTNCI